MMLREYNGKGLLLEHKRDETPDPFYFIMHAHDVCELYYLIEGKGYLTVEGVNYPLEKDAVLLVREGEMHTVHVDPTASYERITVNFDYKDIDPDLIWKELHGMIYDHELGQSNLTRAGESRDYLRTLFSRLSATTEVASANGSEEVRIIFKAILCELLHIRRRDIDADRLGEDTEFALVLDDVSKSEAKLVVEIISYINNHLFDIKNLTEIESAFYFSRSYINRVFKAATKSSVWNYVLLKRLIAAQSFLKGGMPAKLVAEKCGFRDYSSFYKQYKNKFGTAPTSEKTGLSLITV